LPKHHPKLFCLDYIEFQKIQSDLEQDQSIEAVPSEGDSPTTNPSPNLCIRPMCEFAEGWHLSTAYVLIEQLRPEWSPYLARIMNILKNDRLSNQLSIFVTDQGRKQLKEIETGLGLGDEKDVIDSYHSLRSFYAGQAEETLSNEVFLERCELKNGQVTWLCTEHVKETNAKVLSDVGNAQEVTNNDLDKYLLIEEIGNIKLEDFSCID